MAGSMNELKAIERGHKALQQQTAKPRNSAGYAQSSLPVAVMSVGASSKPTGSDAEPVPIKRNPSLLNAQAYPIAVPLRGVVQNYAWGKCHQTSLVAAMATEQVRSNRGPVRAPPLSRGNRFAELWMGLGLRVAIGSSSEEADDELRSWEEEWVRHPLETAKTVTTSNYNNLSWSTREAEDREDREKKAARGSG
ncbi:unnamed protein product [Polarella glacialis]|uniref:Uncharacterized protein n=1 Tax=Polarella glacialis TaxID=89957 RepID=A0A813LSP4_POLGL|nr:unnamed protein product [Polarella glacialis]